MVFSQVLLRLEIDLAAGNPAFQFFLKGLIAGIGEALDFAGIGLEDCLIFIQAEGGFANF
ncbi:MAG: hypothetical protein WD623_15690 [Marinobacter sp.]|uniref:hypothetical protein n=1 Tax=Marinobacter sp. TaxID=50741 RepID=UPI0034A41F45